jgi:hypothetical protein
MLRIPLRGECVVSLDLATAALTHTGNSGITPAGLGEIGSTLFTAADEGTGLYRVNTLTGDLTEISSLGLNGAGFNTLGSTTTGLYALDNSFNLFRINPTTGVATFLGAPGALPASCLGATVSVFRPARLHCTSKTISICTP